jgi:hypothetical protein
VYNTLYDDVVYFKQYHQFVIVHNIACNIFIIIVHIVPDFYMLFRIIHNIVLSWFADHGGRAAAGACGSGGRPGAGGSQVAAVVMVTEGSFHSV